VTAIFCPDTWVVIFLRIGVLCLNDQAWQHLDVLSSPTSLTSRVHEIHIMCINILSMQLRLESGGQIDIRQSSDLYFLMKMCNMDLFENLIFVHFSCN